MVMINKGSSGYLKIIIIAGIFIAFLLKQIFPENSIISIASQTAGYTVIIWIAYAKFIWRYMPKFIENTPYIGGTWKGEIYSDYNGGMKIDSEIKIIQDLFKTKIKVKTNESESETIVSDFVINGNDDNILFYTYRNEPKADVRFRSAIHYGSVQLRLVSRNDLEGSYWTDRKTTGTMKLHRRSV
jgi:hypothetical protein